MVVAVRARGALFRGRALGRCDHSGMRFSPRRREGAEIGAEEDHEKVKT